MKNNTFNIKFWKKNWIAQNFKSLCLICYFTTYKALSIPGRESISYLFSSSPVPSILDKFCYFILIIAPRGRNHYPHFMEEETESQRGKMICKSSKCKARTWTCIWHLSTLLPWVKEKEMCVVKMQMAMTIWKDSSAKF